jgi:hypothetical protein
MLAFMSGKVGLRHILVKAYIIPDVDQMTGRETLVTTEEAFSREIDAIIEDAPGWKGDVLSRLRSIIKEADPDVVEAVKWKMPSKPSGVPVWMHDGNVCIADTLKNSIRLTFPKGAQVDDPNGLFNSRLDSKAVRAIDYFEGDTIDEVALTAIFRAAATLNSSKD